LCACNLMTEMQQQPFVAKSKLREE
jgi:hypothetical protein